MPFMLVFGALTVSANCGRKEPSQVEAFLKGEHVLRKMSPERPQASFQGSAWFIIGLGAASADGTSDYMVNFAWQTNDGTYAISSLPLTSFMIKFDENATTPTVKFRWQSGRSKTVQGAMRLVIYALLTIRESDWPPQVNLPLAASSSHDR